MQCGYLTSTYLYGTYGFFEAYRKLKEKNSECFFSLTQVVGNEAWARSDVVVARAEQKRTGSAMLVYTAHNF